MKVISEIREISNTLSRLKSSNNTIGLIPTMGALHKGHISLVEKSIAENDITVVSIFVNPTQFDKQEDLTNYPITIEKDLELLEKSGCDFVFTPKANEIYDNNISSQKFLFDGLEQQMEGKHRAGHFDGVGTIVKKFFLITMPNIAYFGEKDFQQLQIIKKLVELEKLDIKIIGCPIHREEDGLAMSSRNTRLTDQQRKDAPFIYKTLKEAQNKIAKHSFTEINSWVSEQFKKHKTLNLEYFEIAEEDTLKTAIKRENNKKYRAFIAVFADKIRLIDNISL
ncbi:pantoate--beta-alanine ligase [Flavicella sediminum]|uniref:pantoate--beta-alanine ligase n=1 Tax=Flavicella sediminum TaxID=2585141 RepID=UPI00111E8055|nr:pantoate--beta-alanine ligase [Flavicella sediminum]